VSLSAIVSLGSSNWFRTLRECLLRGKIGSFNKIQFSASLQIPPVIHVYLPVSLTRMTKVRSLGTFQKKRCNFGNREVWDLIHLYLEFHYWNGSDVGVIYILLRKVIAASDFYAHLHVHEGTRYHVVHRVSHCYRHWRVGSLSKSDVNFRIHF
jgi:hypothetical protein